MTDGEKMVWAAAFAAKAVTLDMISSNDAAMEAQSAADEAVRLFRIRVERGDVDARAVDGK